MSADPTRVNPIVDRIARYLNLDLNQITELQVSFDASLGTPARIVWDGYRLIPADVFTAIVEGRDPEADQEIQS